MDASSISIWMELRPATCTVAACCLAITIHIVCGFWTALTLLLFVIGACLPSLITHSSEALDKQHLDRPEEACTTQSAWKQCSVGEATTKHSCPDYPRAHSTRRRVAVGNDYISEHELWMTVELDEQLNEAVDIFFDRLIEQFVRNWYDTLSDDPNFLHEVRRCIRHIVAQVIVRSRRLDLPQLIATRIFPLFIRHIDKFGPAMHLNSETGSVLLGRFFTQLKISNSMTCREQVLNSELHLSLFSRCTELNYARRLLDALLARTDLLPPHARMGEAALVVLREILAVAALVPALDALAEPHFVASCFMKLCDPSKSKTNSQTCNSVSRNASRHDCTDAKPDALRSNNILKSKSILKDVMRSAPRRTVRLLERFVPREGVGVGASISRLRGAFAVTISELDGSQERLFEFMQFVKRAGAVRYLQLMLSLDELNRELFGIALSDSSSRLRKFRDDLTDIVALANERDVRTALEATLDLERLDSEGNSDRNRHSRYLPDSVQQCSELEDEPLNMLATSCTYEQLVGELQRVADGPPNAIGSLLKSFCTLRLFGVVQKFLELSCLREFNAGEAQFWRCFGEPLCLSVHFDLDNCYAATTAQSLPSGVRWRRPLGSSLSDTRTSVADSNPNVERRRVPLDSDSASNDDVQSIASQSYVRSTWSVSDTGTVLSSFIDDMDMFDEKNFQSSGSRPQAGDSSTLKDCRDSFLHSADPELGLPDLSRLRISITCIEQRPTAARVPPTNSQIDQYELIAFFVIDIQCKTTGARWRVARRYNDFYQLEEKLRAFHGLVLDGYRLPPRDRITEVLRRYRSVEQQLAEHIQFLDSLRPTFESFLRSAVALQPLRYSQLLLLFLTNRLAHAHVPHGDNKKGRVDRKRPSEPFVVILARSAEPRPARPSFRRYEMQNYVSFERRVFNNSNFRHARWNDQFELDIIPMLANATSSSASDETEVVADSASLNGLLDDFKSVHTQPDTISYVSATSHEESVSEFVRPSTVPAPDTNAYDTRLFDYFAALIGVASRFFSLHPLVLGLLNGLYRLDAFFSHTPLARWLARCIDPAIVACQDYAVESNTVVNTIVHRFLRERMQKALCDDVILRILRSLTEVVFTKGGTASPSKPQATLAPNVRESQTNNDTPRQTDELVRLLCASYSPLLQLLSIDKNSFKQAVREFVVTLQDPHLNKLLTYQLLDCVLLEMFPELDSN